MLAVSLLLAVVPTKAAPTREARAAHDEIWNLYSGLEASFKYGVSYHNIESMLQMHSIDCMYLDSAVDSTGHQLSGSNTESRC